MTASGGPARRVGVALSLANLCYSSAWAKLVPENVFFLQELPSPSYHAALIANVLGLAVLLWLADQVLARDPVPARYRDLAFWGAFVTALNNLRLHGAGNVDLARSPVALAVLGVLAVLVAAAWRRLGAARLTSAARSVCLATLPFAALTLGQSAWRLSAPGADEGVQASSRAPRGGGSGAGQRVALLIFDEMDYRAAFMERPSDVRLDSFDRLRGESVFAEEALAPARDTTMAVPAVLLGRRLSAAWPISPSEMSVRYEEGGEDLRLSRQGHLFARLRSLGYRSAVVGWCLPYCRLFRDSVSRCSWRSYLPPLGGGGAATEQAWEAILSVPLAYKAYGVAFRLSTGGSLRDRLEARKRAAHIEQHLSLMEAGGEILADPSVDFAFVHLPIPHQPYVYDRQERRVTTRPASYPDNLELADRALGELRRKMADAGLWDRTVVIVTSDHSWRSSGYADRRVPLMIKISGTARPSRFAAPLETVVLHDLIPALLAGSVTTTEALTVWLSGRARGG